MNRQILVPLDGSPYAEKVLPQVEALAHATGDGVRLLLVEPMIDPVLNPALMAAIPASSDEHPTWPRPYLDTIAGRLSARGLNVQADVVSAADVAVAILEQAVHPQVSLIAMASHKRSGMERWILGSVAERVLHAAPKPLFLVRDGAEHAIAAPKVTYGTIAVTLDGSTFATQALEQARALALATDATLLLLAVAPTIDDIGLAEGGLEPLWMLAECESHEACLQRSLDIAAAGLRSDGVRTRTLLLQGAPVETIVGACATERADLLIMATHGRSGLRRLVLGSVATGVLRHAELPVLLIRAGERQAPVQVSGGEWWHTTRTTQASGAGRPNGW